MKVAIVYDRVNKFGGAERVLLTLHEMFPDAPLYTSVYSKDNAEWANVFPKIETSFLNKIKFLQNKHEFLAVLMPFVFSLFNFKNYDLVISVTSEFAKNINVRNGKHICYLLTPTRYLWSGEDEYFKNKYLKIIANPVVNYLKKEDLKASKKPDEIIAISSVVQKRIKKYYQRESKIIFPSVSEIALHVKNKNLRSRKNSWPDYLFFPSASRKVKLINYYLVVSRLVKYKKVDLAIEAFNELNLPLVIVGTGREEKKLKNLANKNVIFLGNIDDGKLSDVYKNAKALIFPQDEDFGIVAVEAQSFGVPVIAYKKGGAIDTVIQNKTGIFFDEQNTTSLIKAIRKFEKTKFNKKTIVKNAKRFSKERFEREFLQVVKSLC